MKEKEVLAKTADTILDKTITITIDILFPEAQKIPKETYAEKLLIWMRLKKRKYPPVIETKRVFKIKKAPVATLIKISLELLDIDLTDLVNTAHPLEENYKLIANHGNRMARIAAIAVTNPKEEPGNDLINFFLLNLDSEELQRVAAIVIQQMDIQNFMSTIISIRGVNILQSRTANAINAKQQEVSQQIAKELIAFGE